MGKLWKMIEFDAVKCSTGESVAEDCDMLILKTFTSLTPAMDAR